MNYSKDKGAKAYKTFEASLRRIINRKGMKQKDSRLNRTTMSLPGHFGILKHPDVLPWLQSQQLLDKYSDDLSRMTPSLNIAISNAKEDKNSRRLMVLNDQDFNEIYPCFIGTQFVYTHRKEFDMYVYQRSSDLAKLQDDCIFFSKLALLFQKKVGKKVTKIVIIFGHIHYEM